MSSGIGALKRPRPLVSLDTSKKIIIPSSSHISIIVWDGINNQFTEKLQNLQNRATRVITKSSDEVSPSPLLDAWVEKLDLQQTKTQSHFGF